jgi:hypothetical protein
LNGMNSIYFIKRIERHAAQAPAPCEGFLKFKIQNLKLNNPESGG